jgi:hypothetical protein
MSPEEEIKWVCSIFKLSKVFFLFVSYSELEETAASFPKLLGKFSIVSYIYRRFLVLSEY